MALLLALFSIILATNVSAGWGGNPQFLQTVNQQGRRAYYDIVKNQNLTLAQINSQTAQWAQTYGVTTQYDQYQSNMTAMRQEVSQNVTSIISNLSAAQTALEAVLNNENQTTQQQREAIGQLRQQYPQEITVLMSIGGRLMKEGMKGMKNGPGQNQMRNGGNRLNNNNNNNMNNSNDFDDSRDNN